MKLYLDEHLSSAIARIARSHGLDIVAADELGMLGVPDEQHLTLATAEDRTLVTSDIGIVAKLSRWTWEHSIPHSGILRVVGQVDRRRFAACAAALEQYAKEHADHPMTNLVDVISIK